MFFDITSYSMQWRIQDFPQGGASTPKIAIIFQIFAENCMKMKEFGPPGARPWRPPWIRQCNANGSHKRNIPGDVPLVGTFPLSKR